MNEDQKKPHDHLARQPDVEPPQYTTTSPPSLFLYSSLLVFAFILLVVAFRLGPPDWSGFLINLASEIIGAVVILTLVERKFRTGEVNYIQGIKKKTHVAIMSWFFENKILRSYAQILIIQKERASLPFYVARPEVENAILSHRSNGFALIGLAGIGKSTLLQFLVGVQAKELLDKPKIYKIPILVPAVRWRDGEAVDILRTTMQSYYPISNNMFYRLLKKGRFMCIFDGLDELIRPMDMISKLYIFKQQYYNNTLIISSRNIVSDAHNRLGLENIVIAPLSTEEAMNLIMNRKRVMESAV